VANTGAARVGRPAPERRSASGHPEGAVDASLDAWGDDVTQGQVHGERARAKHEWVVP